MVQWITFKPRYGNTISVAVVRNYRFTLTSWGLSVSPKYSNETIDEFRMRKINAKALVDTWARSGRETFE